MMRNTGMRYWGLNCPADLQDLIRSGEGTAAVEKVFFAPDDGWIAVRANGSVAWQNLPLGMHHALRNYQHGYGGIKYASVAPDDHTWVVIFRNGRMMCSEGLPHALATALQDIEDDPLWVELGPDESFVALWPNYTLFSGSRGLAEELLSHAGTAATGNGRHSCGCCPPVATAAPHPLRPCIRPSSTSTSQPQLPLGGMYIPYTGACMTEARAPSGAPAAAPAGPSTPPGEIDPYIICSGGFRLLSTPGSPPPPAVRGLLSDTPSTSSQKQDQTGTSAAAAKAAKAALLKAEAELSGRTAELAASKDLVSSLSGKLKDKEKVLQEAQGEWQCSVCWSDPLGLAYTGCGHMVCSSCAPMLPECPICRKASPQLKLFRV
jgi:hypothetical protein